MNKLLLLITLIFAVNLYGYDYQLKIGATYSTASQDEYDKYIGYNTGVVLGWGIGVPLMDKISINGDILFNQKGYTINDLELENSIHNRDMTIHYLELAMNIGYSLFENLSIYLGFSYDILVSECNDNNNCKSSYKAGVGNDFTIILGTKIYYESFFVDFRYSKGVIDIGTNASVYSEVESYYPWEDLQKTQQFSFMIGYQFQ
ncbi:PorT family protein [bacterium]|nr:PorT family protein [bacterium]